jgi:hypothetical protein
VCYDRKYTELLVTLIVVNRENKEACIEQEVPDKNFGCMLIRFYMPTKPWVLTELARVRVCRRGKEDDL